MEAASIQIIGATGPWAYRVNGLYVMSKRFNGRPFYSMVRGKGMEISLHYASDGHWRVKTNLDGDKDEGFAQTEKRNMNIHLEKSSVVNCAWKVKVNLLEDTGMEPAPELQVFALDQSETILRQTQLIEAMAKADKDAHRAPNAIKILGANIFSEGLYLWTGKWQNRRKWYQHEHGESFLRYGPNGLWMVGPESSLRLNDNKGYLKSQDTGFASPADAARSWFTIDSADGKWTPTTGIEVEGLDKFALDAEVRKRTERRYAMTRKSLDGPRQMIIRGVKGPYKDIINGFYEAKPPPPDAQKAIEEYRASWPKVCHRPPSPFTEEEKRQLYNGRLCYVRAQDDRVHFDIWLRNGIDDTWFISPDEDMLQFTRAGFMWSSCHRLVLPMDQPQDKNEWITLQGYGTTATSDHVDIISIDQLARDFIKKKKNRKKTKAALKWERSSRALPLVRRAMEKRRRQVKVTRQFPFALFCIRSASVRSVNTSVVLHGYVRKLIASYLGIDIASKTEIEAEETTLSGAYTITCTVEDIYDY